MQKGVFQINGGILMKSKYSAEEKFQKVMEFLSYSVTQVEMCQRHGIYHV
jgi:transposase-like protein